MKSHLFLFTFLICQTTVLAQPGMLDSTFGTSGTVITHLFGTSAANALAVQNDGKIVATGYVDVLGFQDLFVVRYFPNGMLDTTFDGGTIISDINFTDETGNAIAIQTDGKIVVGGNFDANTSEDFLLLRFRQNGLADSIFGIHGVVTSDFNNNSEDELHDVLVQPDDKILICGWTNGTDKDIALMRFNSSGTIDSTFGNNGRVSTDINNQLQEARAMTTQSDGKIVVAGLTQTPGSAANVALFRYNTDGSLDSSFGTNGIVISIVSNYDDFATDVVLDSDGKILISGLTTDASQGIYNSLIMRFDSTGILDNTFGIGGKVILDINAMDNWSNSMLLQQDGKIIISGKSFQVTDTDFLLARFNSDGSIDNTFGNNGITVTNMANDHDECLASAFQPDGSIILSGYYYDNIQQGFILARYRNDSTITAVSQAAKNQFTLYPSPARQYVHLNMQHNLKAGVNIYDMYGALVGLYPVFENRIDVSSLKSGMYIIQLDEVNKNRIAKFIIAR